MRAASIKLSLGENCLLPEQRFFNTLLESVTSFGVDKKSEEHKSVVKGKFIVQFEDLVLSRPSGIHSVAMNMRIAFASAWQAVNTAEIHAGLRGAVHP